MAQNKRDFLLNVLVVGFHHQKGSQVEFSYPPIKGSLPSSWKYLPYLAIPDGAHRSEQGFVYFTLPEGKDDDAPLFGERKLFAVACYGQLATQDLMYKDKEQTRATVLKSVVVLSRRPCYGFIKAKLSLVTEVYFAQKNFSETKVLEEFYENMNQNSKESHDIKSYCFYVGVTIQPLVRLFRRKLLVIFKLLMLEQRVLFYGFPAGAVSEMLISVVSLFPGLLQSLCENNPTYVCPILQITRH
ncbi:late secretory pathway protein AVL9 homolog isoform X2 [Corticium candelabrum]|uniref:late secretory pathway protein AVL9 homolog isoform X2 n=1 Tax=Corticium candelabrum TaxID=121492 RepID=UPI002E265BE2|nr:late secretory pathway protein AVL9 homolog isoform X2 [Corticium candelabrum]